MNIIQFVFIAITLFTFKCWINLTTGVWKLKSAFTLNDIFGRKHKTHLENWQKRFFHPLMPSLLATILLCSLSFTSWKVIDSYHIFKTLLFVLSAVFTWRVISMDIDIVIGKAHMKYRFLAVLACIGVWFHPAFILILLNVGITWLRGMYHHQIMQIRIMLFFMAFIGSTCIFQLLNVRVHEDLYVQPGLFLILTVTVSHYFIPGVKKLKLGPKWYSWIKDNQLHLISMSAYLWGWLRFLPEKKVIRFLIFLKPFNQLFQAMTISIEIGALLILFDQWLCMALLGSFIIMHLLIFLLTGIFFWQNIITHIVLIYGIYNLPSSISSELFGIENGILAVLILFDFPFKRRVWSPARLGWWDSAFPCRVTYHVTGESGKTYSLRNNFMCPCERIFGQRYGRFLVTEKRINGHIGEITKNDIISEIYAVKKDIDKLSQIKKEFGQSLYDKRLTEDHDEYLSRFIQNFNAGNPKKVFPKWLKAPGGQMFYWDKLPSFKGQEKIQSLAVDYVEEYFDGERIHLITNYRIKDFEVLSSDEIRIDDHRK